MIKNTYLLLLSVLFLNIHCQEQEPDPDPTRFEEEIKRFIEDDKDYSDQEVVIFTGSSSVRLWSNVQEVYPDHNIINTGFGGSQMSDLLYYAEDLILKYQPKQVFIYEGDNDVFYGKTTKEIIKDTKKLTKVIRKAAPNVEIFFISAKPSIARWNLKEQYLDLNEKLKEYCANKKNVAFIDVWTPMMGDDGTVMKDIFIEDNLHMNAKGYKIWEEKIAPYFYLYKK